MSITPDKKVEQVQFCESHVSVWRANAAAIGLSEPANPDVEVALFSVSGPISGARLR